MELNYKIWCVLRNLAGAVFALSAAISCTHNKNNLASQDTRLQPVEILRATLDSQTEWVKVHAAEYLLWAGHPEGVKEVFLEEEEAHGSKSPYRIGIWRVLAQASGDATEKAYWVDKIQQAFRDEDGGDRIHAAETLAKLKTSPVSGGAEVVGRALQGSDMRLAAYTRWSTMFTSSDSFNRVRMEFMNTYTDSHSPKSERELAAYALSRTTEFSSEEWASMADAALSETNEFTTRLYMLSSALMTAPRQDVHAERFLQIRKALSDYEASRNPGLLSELSVALAKRGDDKDVAFLVRLLNEEHPTDSRTGDADVHAAAAFALIQMAKRGISIPNFEH